jgi:shikimate dehydrogenase
MISASTRPFAILGHPVRHSLSPLMHNAAFRVLGIDAVYVALDIPADRVGATMHLLASQGGGGNVTVPHKAEALGGVAPDPSLSALGAVNTFWGEGELVRGANTDVAGVIGAWRDLGSPEGPWLVLGTGGSARGAIRAAIDLGIAVAVRSRDAARGASLEAWATSQGALVVREPTCRVAVNATPLGLKHDDPLPAEPAALPHIVAALDLVYACGRTRWVLQMERAGRPAADGRGVLLHQGVGAFECWFPQQAAPVEVMRAAVHDALG